MRAVLILTLTFMSLFSFAQLPEGTVTGKVLDLNNKPVGGVKLVFVNQLDKTAVEETVTKSNGGFTIRNVRTGPYRVDATKDGFVTRQYKYDQQGEQVRVTWRMVKEGATYASLGDQPTVTGKITTSDGKPVPDVDLLFSSEDLYDYRVEAKTNANGEFSASSLRYADVQIMAKKDGYRPEILRYTQGKKDYKIKKFEMQTMADYAEATGQPAPGDKKERSPEEMAIDFYNRAVGPYKQKNYSAAKPLVQKAIDLNPKMDTAVKLMVYITYNLKEYKDTLTFAQMYLGLKPGDVNMAQYAREAAMQVGDNATAKKFETVLKKSGKITPQDLFNNAINAINANDDATAKEAIKEVLELDANFADAYRELGNIYMREADYDLAVKNFKLFLKYAPKDHPDRRSVTDLIVAFSE